MKTSINFKMVFGMEEIKKEKEIKGKMMIQKS